MSSGKKQVEQLNRSSLVRKVNTTTYEMFSMWQTFSPVKDL